MPQYKAIGLCRVSTNEQLSNNSLARQNQAVKEMADRLGVIIPKDYIWSESMSSKRGKNVNRKDLNEIFDTCKRDRSIKYIIVDEPDRFMRSQKEANYWEVRFEIEVGVKVVYAKNDALNDDSSIATFQRSLEYYKAEGSNEERMRKAVNGQRKALEEGRWPYFPPRGYKHGEVKSIPDKDGEKAELLARILKKTAAGLYTLTESLKEYNKLGPTVYSNYKPIKIDKWKKVVANPFYAGIVEMNKQVKYRNENGLHKPIITKEEHLKLVEIVNSKRRNHKAPSKEGNPKYPLSNMFLCENCDHKHTKYHRFAGITQSNNKKKPKIYQKYRCRGCYRSLPKEYINEQVMNLCGQFDMSEKSRKILLEALETAWKREEGDTAIRKKELKLRILRAENDIESITDTYVNECNEKRKEIIGSRLDNRQAQLDAMKNEYQELDSGNEKKKSDFMKFALNFVDNLGSNFVNLTPKNAQRCKQIIFPRGFVITQENNVYTQEISPLYGLRARKKSDFSDNFHSWWAGRESNPHSLARTRF